MFAFGFLVFGFSFLVFSVWSLVFGVTCYEFGVLGSGVRAEGVSFTLRTT